MAIQCPLYKCTFVHLYILTQADPDHARQRECLNPSHGIPPTPPTDINAIVAMLVKLKYTSLPYAKLEAFNGKSRLLPIIPIVRTAEWYEVISSLSILYPWKSHDYTFAQVGRLGSQRTLWKRKMGRFALYLIWRFMRLRFRHAIIFKLTAVIRDHGIFRLYVLPYDIVQNYRFDDWKP